MSNNISILEVQHIRRSFPGVQALDDISFSVEAGTVHALIGENGAGKSTLIKILSGALQPEAGTIRFDGQPYRPRDPRQALRAGVSTIYQELNLLPQRSVTANIMLGKEPARRGVLDSETAEARVRHQLDLLNASHLSLHQTVGKLNMGEKQIIEIARTLLGNSRLIIMDEPTAALSADEIEALFNVMETLKSKGVTVLYVTHRLDEVFRLSDTVTVLRDGKHIRTAPIQQVTSETLIEDMVGRPLKTIFPPRSEHSDEVVLSVRGLCSGAAFSDISFDLHKGEVLAFTGLTGSGKEALAKAMFGYYPLDAGEIWLSGKVGTVNPTRAIAAGLGCLPDDHAAEGVLAELSVQRNVSLAILPRLTHMLGVLDRAAEGQVAQQQVTTLDIRTPSLDQIVRNLSGGNQQKVALGKWLASGAQVLILIEPTKGIDVGVKIEIYNKIAQLAGDGVSLLLVSSELPEVVGLAHRLLVMREGRIVAELIGAETTSEEVMRYVLGGV